MKEWGYVLIVILVCLAPAAVWLGAAAYLFLSVAYNPKTPSE